MRRPITVSFQWKNPDFLFRNPDFLLKHVDFITKQELWAYRFSLRLRFSRLQTFPT